MFILLLGSYDDETKKALYTMQESIANSFSDKGYYSLSMRINSSIDVKVTSCFLSINAPGDPLREIKLGDLEI